MCACVHVCGRVVAVTLSRLLCVPFAHNEIDTRSLFHACRSCLHARRHGESTWNNENRFTGWKDVPLSEKGEMEAAQCGDLIKESGLTFDVAYTSVLKV